MKSKNKFLLSDRFKNDGKSTINLNAIQVETANVFCEDVDAGVYEFETYDCECGTKYEDLLTIAEKDRYGFDVSTKICPKCGLLMTNPRMTQKSYDDFYNKVYGKLYRGSETSTEEIFNFRKKRGVILHEYLKKNCDISKIKNVLEIGCADGGILAGLISCGMKNCKGIDLGSKYIDFGKSQGLDMECCHSKELLARGEKYDLIILSHVLERFLDIKSELAIICELLSDEGLFYVEVPGLKNVCPVGAYGGNFLLYFQNAHVRHFCRDTLSQVMRWNGFEEVTADETIRSLYKKSDNQDNECVNYFADVLSYLQDTEKKYTKIKTYLTKEKKADSAEGMLTHVTFPFTSNAGDTALSYCVRRAFDRINNNDDKYSYYLVHIHWPVTDEILENINRTKGVIVGGGGVFLPDTNQNNITGWQWICPKEKLKEITVPIVLYTVGYNYFRGQEPSEIFVDNLNSIIEKSSFVGLRNSGSVEKIQSLLKDNLKNKVVFQPCTTTLIRKIVPDLPKKKPSKKVAVNIAFDRINMRLGGEKELILRQTAKAMKKFNLWAMEFISFHIATVIKNF